MGQAGTGLTYQPPIIRCVGTPTDTRQVAGKGECPTRKEGKGGNQRLHWLSQPGNHLKGQPKNVAAGGECQTREGGKAFEVPSRLSPSATSRERTAMPKPASYDCDSTAPLRASLSHYQYHYRRGEASCPRSLQELALKNQRVRERQQAGGWDVYVVRFQTGEWYYGSCLAVKLRQHDITSTNKAFQALLKAGVSYTVERLAVCDTKEQALQLECRLILASDRTRLLNRKLPWHFCNIYTEGTSGYNWHQYHKDLPACENALKARREHERSK